MTRQRSIVNNTLSGIRILDLSRVFAGPASGQMLGDLGADVIKIELPVSGDEARYYGTDREGLARCGGVSPSFLAFNRNKRSLALDIGKEAGRDVVMRLVSTADVIIHNFRPGTMERFGLGYDELSALNPRLIYAELSSYGREGPLAHVGANDLALQAQSGLLEMTGESDGPPVRCGPAVIDLHAGLGLFAAIMGALLHRERYGVGQFVETSLLRSATDLMGYFYTEYWSLGIERRRMGTANHLSVPNQVFPTLDGNVVIIAPGDDMWRRCAQALDAEKLDKPEYYTMFDRRERSKQLIRAIASVTSTLTCDELLERMARVKVNAARVNTISEASASEQIRAIGAIHEYEFAGLPVKVTGAPFAMTGADMAAHKPAPKLGEHSFEVLSESGYSQTEIAALAEAGIVGVA